MTLASPISGSGGQGAVDKIGGTGTLILSAANTFTGGTEVDQGTLKMANANALGSGLDTVISSPGILDLNGYSPTLGGLYGNGTITTSTGTSALTVTNDVSGPDSEFDGVIQNGAGTVSLTKIGSCTFTLTGQNTYTGGTTISAGTLDLSGGNNRLATSGALTVASGGTLDLGGYSQTVTGVFSLQGGTVQNGTLYETPAFAPQSGTISAVLAGSVGLTKSTAGLLTLSGTNTYTGSTVVSAGDLQVDGSITSSCTTVNGGTLSGVGTTGNVTVSSGTLSPGDNTIGTLNTGNLALAAGDTLSVNLTDTGAGCVNVNGAVSLNGATLNVTSSRSDAYGVLRVLVKGASSLAGTFAGLAEGSQLTVGGQTYYITYHYNSQTGQFGAGNDVALVSTLFGVTAKTAVPYTITAASRSTQTVLDATQVTSTTAVCSNQYQLSYNLSQFNPAWAAGNPTITYSSLEPSVASVSSGGLVTFAQSGTCQIIATATESGYANQTCELRLSGTVSGGIQTVSYVPITITPANIGQYVLVLYNAGSTNSTTLMNYYKANRPGVANANYLGITGVPDATWASATQCNSLISQVTAWLQANPSKPIRYILGLCGLPSIETGGYGEAGPSVPETMYLQLLNGKATYSGQGAANRFSLAQYGAPLIDWLDCGSYAATTAYINKEIAAANAGGLQTDGISISGTTGGVGGTTYALDDTGGYYNNGLGFFNNPAYGDYDATLLGDGVPGSNIMDHTENQNQLITSVTNPTAYGTWGSDGGQLLPTFPIDGSVKFSGKAGWWLGMSVESFDGVYGGNQTMSQSDPTEWFASNAFGGTNYSNTPICFVGNTQEPLISGCVWAPYFGDWSKGWSTSEAAWAGETATTVSQGNTFLVISDIGIVDAPTSPSVAAPSAPAGLVASYVPVAGIKLSWTAPSGTIAGYNVYRGTTPGGENYAAPLNGATPITNTTYTDTTTVGGTTYYYTVESVVALNPPTVAGLDAYYNLDGTLGAISNGVAVADTSGNNLTATMNGSGTSYVAGKFNQGINFTGSQDLAVPDSSCLNLSDNFTVSAWINLPSLTTGGIVGTRFGGDDTFAMKYYNPGSNPGIQVSIGNGTTWLAQNTLPATLTTGAWHLVTCVVTDVGYTVYLDGAALGSGMYSGVPLFMKSGETMEIGNDYSSDYLTGSMDDVAVFGTALTAPQVNGLYLNQLPSLASNESSALTCPAAPTGLAAAVSASSSQLNLSWTAPSGTVSGYNIYRGTTPGGENYRVADQRFRAGHDDRLQRHGPYRQHRVLLHDRGGECLR